MTNESVFLVEADMVESDGTDMGSHDITEFVGVAKTMKGAKRLKKEYDERQGKNHWPGTPECTIKETKLYP